MTFLSIPHDAFDGALAGPQAMTVPRRPRASMLGQIATIVIVGAGLTVPGGVVRAKWTKLALVATIVQQRCMAAVAP